jgi:proteic killer suppression protein
VIRSFHDDDTQALFRREFVKKFEPVARVALRKLVLLDQIQSLHELKGPGFSLEALKGDRKGQHSLRINDKWRICFVWTDQDAYRVEITDYH